MTRVIKKPRRDTLAERDRQTTTYSLLLATDGSPATDAAMDVTSAIAAQTGAAVRVLAVHVPVALAGPELPPPTPEMDRAARNDLRLEVTHQFERLGIPRQWPIDVRSGRAATTIVKAAEQQSASLVVMGLGKHGPMDRVFGTETVLQVLRLGRVSALAVAPTAIGLPRRALAAVDFTPSSARAVALAASILAPEARLMLAHVVSADVDPANWTSPDAAYTGTVGRAFNLVAAEAQLGEARRMDRKVLPGDPATALLHLAEAEKPDLIVAGSHGHGFLSRLLLGSVSERLIREARCSVLVAPPQHGPSYLDEVPELTTRFSSYAWVEQLEEFTRQNAGRASMLEVIDPEIGAQVEQAGLPFAGAAFDPRNAQVQIMFGPAGSRRHLTRSIGNVTAIQVLRDHARRDVVLRVAHGTGQTLLMLDR